MPSTALAGILPALVTPLRPSGELEPGVLRSLVNHLLASGVGGLLPCGSTGEFPYLTLEERRTVSDIVLEETAGRAPVVPQTGAMTTADTIALSQQAQAGGAAAVMIVAPYYEPLKWNELVAHYSEVRAAIDIPIVYYNLPSVTGIRLSTGQLVQLAHETGFEYIKDTGGNAQELVELLREHREDVTVLVGWDSLTYFGFMNGAQGSIWGAANFIPDLCVDLYQAVVQGDFARSQTLWDVIWPICQFLEGQDYTSAVKAACRLSGFDVGPTRRPLLEPDGDSMVTLRSLLARADSVRTHQA